MGMACTVATALFATGGGCSDRRLAVALLVWSPILSMVPPVLTRGPRLGPGSGATLAGVVAIVMGALNAIVVWMTVQLLDGGDLRDIGAVLVFSLPFGGVPGAGYAVPIALATFFARRKADAPRGAIGAGRRLLLAIAIVASATALLVARADHVSYSMWPAILAFDALLGAVCVAVAARDSIWAVRLMRLARDTTGRIEIALPEGEPNLVGVQTLHGGGGRLERTTVVYRLEAQDALPYRSAPTRVPILALDAPPRAVARSFLVGAALLVVCAAVLGWSATQVPDRAPDPEMTCADPLVAPVPDSRE